MDDIRENKEPAVDQAPPERPFGKQDVREVHHHHYRDRYGFNFGRLFFGLLLVLFGIFFLAKNLGWIPADFNIDIGRLWPLLIVFAGLSMLVGRGWVSAIVGSLITLLIVALVAVLIFGSGIVGNSGPARNYAIDAAIGTAVSSIAYDLDFGAASIKISGSTAKAAEGNFSSNIAELKQETSQEKKEANNRQTINLSMAGDIQNIFGRKVNDLDLKVNDSLPIDVTLDSGASSMDLDFSKSFLENLTVKTGASSLKLVLGDKATSTKVDIDGGASSVEISVPKTIGVKVTVDSGLSSRDIEGLDRSGNSYLSPDFDKAAKKAEFDLSLGLSSLKLNWQ